MKRYMCLAIAAVSAAALLLGPLTASASHQTLRDPDDTKGRFDIRRVETWGTHSRMGYEIFTFRRWSAKEVWDAGFFVVNVDTFGGQRADYYVLVRSNGRRMQGLLFRDYERSRDRRIAEVTAWKSTPKSVKFRFPWSKVRIADERLFVRWSVSSIFNNDFCLNVCIDDAPNAGQVVTEIRTPPTPTPTVTPSD